LLLFVFAAFMESGRSWRVLFGDIGGMTIGVMLLVLLLESALIAARVFRYETAGRTWPALTLLPMARIELVRDKLLGCILGLLPTLGYLFLGTLLAPGLVGELVEECLRDGDAFFAVNYLLTQVALFLHLTVLWSLLWNWSAWPVSILLAGLIVAMGNLMLIACASGGGGPVHGLFFVLWCFGAGSAIAVFMWIGVRLEYLAGT
jgi:hypothetical protein